MRALRNSLIIVGAVFIIAVLAIVGTKLFSDPSRSVNEAQSESATSPAVREQVSPAQKGSWTATSYGVSVYIPSAADGEVLTNKLASSEMQECDPMAVPRVPIETRVEEIDSRYFLFTTTDGPSKIEKGLPVGYSHTPAGAATAMYNASVALIPVDTDGKTFVRSDAARERLADPELDPLPMDEVGGYSKEGAAFPFYFRVLSCNQDAITLEIANAYGATTEPIAAVRMQMVWRDNDWRVNVAAPIETRDVTGDEVGSWARWKIG